MKTRLAEAAKAAMTQAYAPYSHFCVGAALLCEDGSVYTGCNIENASYGATLCAERTAIAKAVADGKRQFCAIAVCGGKDGMLGDETVSPCGVCRQVMREFCDDDFSVYLVTRNDVHTATLSQLLPMSFGPDTLKSEKTH